MIASATYRSLSFNDTDHFVLNGVRGLSNPPVRFESFDVPLANYGVFVSAYYGRRAFSLEGLVIGSDVEDFIAKCAELSEAFSIFNGEQPLVFTLSNGQTRTISCVASDEVQFEPDTDSPVACQFRIPMQASFPFLVANSSTSITLGATVIGGGDVPADVPMDLSANSGGSGFIVNAGNAPAYPTARIVGPVTNPALRNLTTGRDVQFNLELTAGQYIDIDFRHKTVRDNTGRNRYATFAGKWWTCDPGTTEVRYVSDTNDPDSTATITAEHTYLSLR